MGNYISCTLTGAHPATATQIILPTSEIRHVSAGSHTSAADLMLDFPGHFLVSSRSLLIGRRFLPLSADEDLEPGHVYVMFPMSRVNSLVNAADMGPLILAAGKAVRKTSGGTARVLPEVAPQPAAAEEEEDESVTEFRNRLSLCRSRRPTLETIVEETCAC